MRQDHPHVKNILVLPCKPENGFVLPDCFDEATYLQNNDVAERLAKRNTCRSLVRSVDYVISGIATVFNDGRLLYNFAKKSLKSMYNVVTDKSQFWLKNQMPIDIENAIAEYEERMKTDEEFRMLVEETIRRCSEQAAAHANEPQKKRKKGKRNEYNPPVWITVERR